MRALIFWVTVAVVILANEAWQALRGWTPKRNRTTPPLRTAQLGSEEAVRRVQ